MNNFGTYLAFAFRGTNIQKSELRQGCHSIGEFVYFYHVEVGKFIFA